MLIALNDRPIQNISDNIAHAARNGPEEGAASAGVVDGSPKRESRGGH